VKTILVPSDFSANAENALQYAIRMSLITGANLVVFHCYLPPLSAITHAKTEVEREMRIKNDMDILAEQLQLQAANAYRKLGMAKVPKSTKFGVEMGSLVVEKIIEVAKTQKADLIIMGTHGASGLSNRLFGSNTSNTIAKSNIPVLAIPVNWEFEEIQSIVMATDLDDFANELDEVLQVAAVLNTRIDIVYLDYGIDPYKEKENNATRLIEKNPYKKIRFTRQNATIEKPLLVQLKNHLNEVKPQWLVMFTKEQKPWSKLLLWSKTEAMVNSCQLPILSFKKRMTTTVR
jgi:nucleotide-binding universal stress UspA family protein